MQSAAGRGASAAVVAAISIAARAAPWVFSSAKGAAYRVTLIDLSEDDDFGIEARTATTIYVCTTCRRATDPDGVRPGATLADETAKAARGTGIAVCKVRCLANCNRALSAAMRCDGSWTYVFGELETARDAPALIDGARLLARAKDGLLPWRGRPEILKRGLIARVPPLDFEEETE